jgi:hypothetical protein
VFPNLSRDLAPVNAFPEFSRMETTFRDGYS